MEITQRVKERLRQVQDWNAIIDEIEADTNQIGDPRAQSNALFELAQVCESFLLDKARAMHCYQKAFKLDQKNLFALQHAREIYQEMAHLEMVTKLMGLELRNNQDPERSAALNYAYGRAALNLGQIDSARPFLEAAVKADPNREEYKVRLLEIQYDRSNWQSELDSLINALVEMTGESDPLGADVANKGKEYSEKYLKVARILQQESPQDMRLLPALFKALDAEPHNDEAGFLAETLLAATGRLQHIQKLQDRRANLVENFDERALMYAKFGMTWNVRLNNPEMAAYFFRQALELAYGQAPKAIFPGHVAAYRVLKHQAEKSGEIDGLVGLAERGLNKIDDDFDASIVALEAGEIAWRKTNDLEAARRLLKRAQIPEHPVVHDFERTIGKLDPVIADVSEQAANQGEAVPEPASKSEAASERAAEIATKPAEEKESSKPTSKTQKKSKSKSKNKGAATRAAQENKIADTANSVSTTAEASSDSATAPSDSSDLDEALELDTGDEPYSPEEQSLIVKAKEAEKQGGKRAVDAWRDVVNQMPGKRYPRQRLRQLYEGAKRWSSVADLIKEEIKSTKDEGLKEKLHWELIELYRNKLRQPGLVVTTLSALEKLIEKSGDNERLLKVVEAQQAQFDLMKRWPDLIGRIRKRAELSEDLERRAALHLEAGLLFLDKFNNQAEAIRSFEAVLEADPRDPTAIEKLKDLYHRRRDWEKLIHVQQSELQIVEDPEERKRQLLEIARTAAQKVKKPTLSIELWNAVLEQDSSNIEALNELQQLHERERNWSALAEVLERCVQVATDTEKQAPLLATLGSVYSDRLSDNKSAIRIWEQLFEIDSENKRAHDALKRLYVSESDLASLESLYARQGKWAEFVRVMERESESPDLNDVQRTSLILKVSSIYSERLDKPDRAVRALEKGLSKDENNLQIAEALIGLYDGAGEERKLLQPLEIKFQHCEDETERQLLLSRLADLAERVEKDLSLAFGYLKTALAQDHTRVELVDDLMRIAEKTQQWPELGECLQSAYQQFGDTVASIDIRVAAARVFEEQLEDFEQALAIHQSILAIEPEHSSSLGALERLFVALGREESLLEVLATKLSLVDSDEEKRPIQQRIGGILERSGQSEKAIEAFQSVIELGGESLEVLSALDRLYASSERWEDLSEIIRRQIELESEDISRICDLQFRLGVLYQDRLNKTRESLGLFRQVLEDNDEHSETIRRLEGLLEESEFRDDIVDTLCPVYEKSQQWQSLVDCLAVQSKRAGSGQRRLQILQKMGEIVVQELGDSEKGFALYSEAFQEDSENAVVQAELEKIATLDNRWLQFAELYEKAVAKDLPSTLQQQLLTKLASVYDHHLQDVEKAIVCYQRSIDIDPENKAGLSALETLYQRTENWSELLSVYRRKIAIEEDSSEREKMRFQIAQLQEDMLGESEQAIVTYSEVLVDSPDNLQAMVALDRLHETHENWSELAEILDQQLQMSQSDDEIIKFSLRLGDIRTNKLGQPALAMGLYSRVLELSPGDETAMAALESMLEDPDQQVEVAKILEPIYRTTNRWSNLVQAYEIMVARTLEPAAKVKLLHQIAELYEIDGGESEKAFSALCRAFREDVSNDETRVHLDRLAALMGNYQALVEIYEEVVDGIVDDELRAEILTKVAQIYDTTLGNSEEAAASYEKILAIDPNNFSAIDLLIEVRKRTQQYGSLVEAICQKAEMVDAKEERKELLIEAAEIRETAMGDGEQAAELYQQVLALDDSEFRALDALERLYLGLERWDSLKDVYARKSELAEHPDERRIALKVLGQVYDRELSDVSRAIDTYQAILDIAPDDYEAIQALDRLYGKADRSLDQLQILQRAILAAERSEEATEIRFRVGRLWEQKLHDTVRAVEAYREVLINDPTHDATFAALDRIAHGDSEPLAAAEVLEPYYEQLGEWEKLVDLYEIMAKHADDPVIQSERLHQIAGIYEDRMHLYDQAFSVYSRALEIDPHDTNTVAQMERLAEQTNDWSRFVELLAEQSESILDTNIKVAILTRIASLELDKLGRIENAVVRYKEIVFIDPDNRSAIAALNAIFTELERWPELVENLRREIRIADDDHSAIELQFRMGQIFQHQMSEIPDAIDAYRDILAIDPSHAEALVALEEIFSVGTHELQIADILEPIYHAQEQWEQLVRIGEVRLSASSDVDARLGIIQTVSDICERQLGDANEAFFWWLRAYMDDPQSEQVATEIYRLAEQTGSWSYIVDVGEQILEVEGGVAPEVRLSVLTRSAQILDEHIQDFDRAVAVYREVLSLDPTNPAGLEALDRIYSQAQLWEDLAEIIQRRIQNQIQSDVLVELESRLAGVFERHLGQTEQAIATYHRVLEHDPSNMGALEALERLYLAEHRWQALFDNYQRMVDIAATDEDMAGYYQRMAKISSDVLERESDSIDLWNRVLDLRGEDPDALSELAYLYEIAERNEELVDVLERQIYIVDDPMEKAMAYQRLGRAYGEKLNNERSALDAWLSALECDPTNWTTLDTLKGIYERNESWSALIDIISRMTELADSEVSPDRLRDLYAQLGTVQGEQLLASDEAVLAWQQVLAIRPDDLEALAALERLYSDQAQWDLCIEVLERKVSVAEDLENKVDILMQIASIWEENLQNEEQAIIAYTKILELEPSHIASSEALEQIYRRSEEWNGLTDLLLGRAAVLGNMAAEIECYQQAARIFEEELHDLESAFTVLQHAFSVDYGNSSTARELERLATGADKWNELLEEYNEVVSQIEDPLERCELWVKIGHWYNEHLGSLDQGIFALQQALELNPESVNALRELANFYRKSGNHEELALVLARVVPLEVDAEVQAVTLLDLAQVQDQGLQDTTAAIESYRNVLAIDGESLVALEALSRLHEQREEWTDLVNVLSRAAAIQDPESVLEIKRRIGEVQEHKLEDTTAAIWAYRDIVSVNPSDQESLAALERLFLSSGKFDDYLDTLEAQLDTAADSFQQISIYEKMADALAGQGEDKLQAAEALEKIIIIDPSRDDIFRRLEQLYGELERWSEVVDTYRTHVENVEDELQRVELLQELATVFEKEIEDNLRAIDTHREILDIDPNNFNSAHILSRLQEGIEDWPAAVETMGRLAELTDEAGARVDLLTRIGRVLFRELGESDQAEIRLNEALTIEPTYIPALIALAEIYRARQDWIKTARTLQTAAECSQNTLEKTNLASEAGFVFLEELGDTERAIELFSSVMTIDPEQIRVGQILGNIYFEAQKYSEAYPILEMLCRKSEQLDFDDSQLRDLYVRTANVAKSQQDLARALVHYEAAYELDSTNHEVLVGMAELLFQQENWDQAFKLYQTILVQHRESQSDDEIVLVYYRLGAIKRHQNEPRKALNYMEKALEVQPYHRETLEAVIQYQSESGDWEAVISAKRALAEVADGDGQFESFKEIGEIYLEKLGNRKMAAEALAKALELRPSELTLLHALLDVYTTGEQWEDAISIIDRIVAVESDPVRRSRYNYTAAVLLRDHLRTHDEAIERFNVVLDDDPGMLKAFQALDAMVTQTKDWKMLERSYRKMLKRLPADGEETLKLALWGNLGEIYRSRLRDFKSAAAAFEVAARMEPENVDRHVILAELYEQLQVEHPQEYVEHAVREHQILIKAEPFRTASYHALYKIYRAADETDKAFCIASALVFLRKANDEETAFAAKYQSPGFVQARQRLSEQVLRKHVLHPDQDRFLTGILGLAAPALAGWRAQAAPNGLDEAGRVDINVDPSLVARISKYVRDVINVEAPDMYLRPNEPGDVSLLNLTRGSGVRPTMVVFQNLLRGKREEHLAFSLGRYMAELYPPHYAYVALDRSPRNLKQVIMACLHFCGLPVPGDQAALEAIAKELTGRMTQATIDQLRSLVRKYAAADSATDVKQWAAAAELTSYRIGLLLCADLAVAGVMVSQEQNRLGSMIGPKDKVKELVLYSVSEDYFQARKAIGIQVG